MAAITTPWGGVITQTYDAAGRPLKRAWNNPKNWNGPSGKTAIIEFSCLMQLGAGNGVTVGGVVATFVGIPLAQVATALGAANAQADVDKALAAIAVTAAAVTRQAGSSSLALFA